MPPSNINDRINKHRAARRMAGLRPCQIPMPDTARQDFPGACRRQSSAVTQADEDDEDTQRLLDQAASGLDGWSMRRC